MKRAISLASSLCVVVGCFGKSTPSTPAMLEASPAATQAQEPAGTPATKDVHTATSSPSPSLALSPVVAKDSEMTIADVAVGDRDLTSAVRFSADRAGVVLVHPQSPDELRLFRVRTDQFGQTELVGELPASGAVEVSLSSAGTYLVAGKEKPLSFENEPLAMPVQETQYRVQAADCDHTLWIEGPAGARVAVDEWTRDTNFPSSVDVYIHHAAGGESKPNRYSFQALVEDGRVPEAHLNYIRDSWDTRLTPDKAATEYNRVWECGDPGRTRLDLCHSAGCLKALIAYLQSFRSDHHYWNNRGIIAVAPAFGGSHTQIKELFDAWAVLKYKPKRFGALYLLAQRDLGFVTSVTTPEVHSLSHLLTGTSFTLFNELGRALAWNGVGTGIPTLTYNWFSEFNFGIPYLQRRLKPEARFLTIKDNALSNYAPEFHTNFAVGGGGEYFNYIEAFDRYRVAMQNWLSPSHGVQYVDKKVDVITTYLNRDVTNDVRAFEAVYTAGEIIANLWRLVNPSSEYRLTFEKNCMPWLHAFIATAPSVIPHDPLPNENAANDGTLTIAQQLGLKDGTPLLASGSVYGALKINDTAIKERLPSYVGEYARFENVDHIDAGITNLAIRAQIKQWISRRLAPLRQEETAYVLTDEDRGTMRRTLFPDEGLITNFDYTLIFKDEYWFNDVSGLVFTQDPLNVGQKNRVRMSGSGRCTIRHYKDAGSYYSLQKTDETRWNIQYDFIRRNGVWHIVIP